MVILSFFCWQILAKTCSIMVSRGVCMGMAGRGDFSRICFFFLKVYVHFLFFVEKRMRFLLLFFDVLFFCFTRVSFKKQQKKLNPHSMVKYFLFCGKNDFRQKIYFRFLSEKKCCLRFYFFFPFSPRMFPQN